MAHHPTLKQLRYLVTLAETRHFGNAAKACHVSQSTLSAGIHELEQQLGVTLVERNSKHILLTQAGEDVVRRALSVLNQVDDLVAACEVAREPFNSRMRLGVIPTIAPFLLPRLLKILRRKYPHFQLFIRENLTDRLIEELERGELDVLLLALPYSAEGMTTEHLFYDDFLLAMPKEHPLENKKTLYTSDLRGQELLLLEDGHCLRQHAMEACRLNEADFSVPYQATSLNTIVQMIANGIGITLLPRMAEQARILSGTEVVSRPFTEKEIRRSIGLMWRQKSPRCPEFRLLGEFIKQHRK